MSIARATCEWHRPSAFTDDSFAFSGRCFFKVVCKADQETVRWLIFSEGGCSPESCSSTTVATAPAGAGEPISTSNPLGGTSVPGLDASR